MKFSLTNKAYLVKFIISLIGFVFFAAIQSGAYAQTANDISISAIPQFPKVNEVVSLQLSSLSTDLNRASISWTLNGEVRVSGIGKTNFQFTTGPLGSVSRITASITTIDGRQLTRSTAIRSTGVDILWEAFSYTPPFYKGRAVPSFNGLVTLIAIPELVNEGGSKTKSSEVVYQWKQGGISLGSASGYGRQKVVINTGLSPRRLQTITVEASTLNGALRAEGAVSVPNKDPIVLFYKKHPLQGIGYEKALKDSVFLNGEEIILRAEPYFFSLDDLLRDELRYTWNVNNSPISVEDNQKEVTFRREIQGGTSLVSLKIKNKNLFRVLQKASETLSIKY